MRRRKRSAASRAATGFLTGRGRAVALGLALLAGTAACGVEAPRADAAGAASGRDSAAAPEPPRPETTWVSLASLRSGDAQRRTRRRTFRTSTRGFRVIVELRDPTTRMSPGRLVANLLSPTTTLPIRTLESRIPPGVEARADTLYVDAAPGEYTVFVLHDYGVRAWSVSVQEAGAVRASTQPAPAVPEVGR